MHDHNMFNFKCFFTLLILNSLKKYQPQMLHHPLLLLLVHLTLNTRMLVVASFGFINSLEPYVNFSAHSSFHFSNFLQS